MNYLNRFVDRPVLASVVALIILLLGLQAIASLRVRQYPETTSSTINIGTPYAGANAELVRSFITAPLEAAIATADGIEHIESTSSQGQSLITTRLQLGLDPNEAVAVILDPSGLTDYLNRTVRPRLETADGIQQAQGNPNTSIDQLEC